MFKVDAIILEKTQVRDKKIGVHLFTREYGKVFCWYNKKSFHHDIGDIVCLYIERNEGNNAIKNISSSIWVPLENWSYSGLYNFMEIVWLFGKGIADGDPHISIFDDYKNLLMSIRLWIRLEKYHYDLYKFRILKHLWVIHISEKDISPVINYIHTNISKVPINTLISSKKIQNHDALLIERINLKALHEVQKTL